MASSESHKSAHFSGNTIPSAAVKARIVAPDIARGLALFGIAWANLSTAWAPPPETFEAGTFGGFHPAADNQFLDKFFIVLSAMFAHNRGLPLFTFLLGFGVGLIFLSLEKRGFPLPQRKTVLVRRYLWLLAFGFVHCIFLFWGDILILYGVLALILIIFIHASNKALLIAAAILYALNIVSNIGLSLFMTPELLEAGGEFMPAAESYGGWVLFGLFMSFNYLLSAPVLLFSMLPVMILGFVAARKRIHQQAASYLRMLWTWVVVAGVVIVGIGLPWGLNSIGVIDAGSDTMWSFLNQAFGYLTGPGIAALILLACIPLQNKRDRALHAGQEPPKLPLVLRMVEALGARSMSGYIFQSFAFFTICLPFTLNYGPELGATGQFLLALAVWLVSLFAAYALSLADKRGPFELLHRRLSYGKAGLPERYVDKSQPNPALPTTMPPH